MTNWNHSFIILTTVKYYTKSLIAKAKNNNIVIPYSSWLNYIGSLFRHFVLLAFWIQHLKLKKKSKKISQLHSCEDFLDFFNFSNITTILRYNGSEAISIKWVTKKHQSFIFITFKRAITYNLKLVNGSNVFHEI